MVSQEAARIVVCRTPAQGVPRPVDFCPEARFFHQLANAAIRGRFVAALFSWIFVIVDSNV